MKIANANLLFQRALDSMIKELDQFTDDASLWKTVPGVNNSCGNLMLHLIGNINAFIGATLLGTDYKRNRDAEFQTKDLSRDEIKKLLNDTKVMLENNFTKLTEADMEKPYPFDFAGKENTEFYVTMFIGHCQYHLGQINYLRRVMAHS